MGADLVSFPSDTPERLGMSRAALNAWKDRLAALKTTALLVIRHDKIVYEWYAEGHGPDRKQGTASLAKAIVGGTSLMVALEDRFACDGPAKRIGPEQNTMTLVFSGVRLPDITYDAFCVRKIIFELAPHAPH
jgi:hypothetical protein